MERPRRTGDPEPEGDGRSLELHALGPVDLPGAAGLTQPKRLALLLYLVLARPRGYQRRDKLLALFWPNLDQARGRKALSQAIFFLRRVLPVDVLLTRGSQEVGVDSRRIRNDVLEFEEALSAGRWREALASYRADLMEGFHLAGAPAFHEWMEREREQLRELAAGAAWSRAREALAAGSLAEAERAAHRGLRLAIIGESQIRDFMRALAETGNRAAALRLYQSLEERLAMVLEEGPAPETTVLAATIRGNRVPRPGGWRPAASIEHPAVSLFQQGMSVFESGLPEDYVRGLSRFEAALRLDPDHARAHAGLALLLAAYPTLTYKIPMRYEERLSEAVGRALELDPTSGHARIAKAYYLWTRKRDWLGADMALSRAMETEPDDLHILLLAAEYHRMLGRLDEATAYLDRLEGSGPLPSYAQVLRAGIALSRSEHGEVDPETPVRLLDALIAAQPAYGLAHLWRAIALSRAARRAEVLDAVDTSLRIHPDVPLAHGFRGAVLGREGRISEAMEEEEWFRAEREGPPVDRFCWGLLRFGIGDPEGGFRLMEEGVHRHPSFLIPGFRLLLAFQRYWDDPRFLAIMRALWPGRQQRVLGPYGWRPGAPPSGSPVEVRRL